MERPFISRRSINWIYSLRTEAGFGTFLKKSEVDGGAVRSQHTGCSVTVVYLDQDVVNLHGGGRQQHDHRHPFAQILENKTLHGELRRQDVPLWSVNGEHAPHHVHVDRYRTASEELGLPEIKVLDGPKRRINSNFAYLKSKMTVSIKFCILQIIF